MAKRKISESKLEASRQKRANLSALSDLIKDLIELGMIQAETTNAGLIEYYMLNFGYKTNVFNTYEQWKELGAQVKKGEVCVSVWSAPTLRKTGALQVPIQEPASDGTAKEEDKRKDWHICNLFHESQVEYPNEI